MVSVLSEKMIPGTEVRLAGFGSFQFSNGVGISNFGAIQFALEELTRREILPQEEEQLRKSILSATLACEGRPTLSVILCEVMLSSLGISAPNTS